jgi:ABC-2 type transport system permease protein
MTTLTAPIASVRADLLRMRRWPTVWVLVAVWTTMQVTFSFAFPYIAYRSGDPDAFQGGPGDQLLASMLPDAVPAILVQGTPMFGGAIVLILGALAAGSGYGWGTWKTVLTQGPGRGSVVTGTVVSVGLIVAGLVLWTLCLDLGLSSVIALTESQDVVLPGLADTARAAGGATLILGMWAAAGLFLGTLTRGPALSVGLGLVWTLVLENLLRGAANLLDGLTLLTDRLPGTAAGSLAGALGAVAEGPDATPGVLFLAATVLLVRRRDLT